MPEGLINDLSGSGSSCSGSGPAPYSHEPSGTESDSSFETEDSSYSCNDRLTADSSCMVKTNFEQSTADSFSRCVCGQRLKQKSESNATYPLLHIPFLYLEYNVETQTAEVVKHALRVKSLC